MSEDAKETWESVKDQRKRSQRRNTATSNKNAAKEGKEGRERLIVGVFT